MSCLPTARTLADPFAALPAGCTRVAGAPLTRKMAIVEVDGYLFNLRNNCGRCSPVTRCVQSYGCALCRDRDPTLFPPEAQKYVNNSERSMALRGAVEIARGATRDIRARAAVAREAYYVEHPELRPLPRASYAANYPSARSATAVLGEGGGVICARGATDGGNKATALNEALSTELFKAALLEDTTWSHPHVEVGFGDHGYGLYARQDIPAFTIVALFGRSVDGYNSLNLDGGLKVVITHPKSGDVAGGGGEAAASAADATARRVINLEDYSLDVSHPDGVKTCIPIAANGTRLHFGGLVNHEPHSRAANAEFVSVENVVEGELACVVMTRCGVEGGDEKAKRLRMLFQKEKDDKRKAKEGGGGGDEGEGENAFDDDDDDAAEEFEHDVEADYTKDYYASDNDDDDDGGDDDEAVF